MTSIYPIVSVYAEEANRVITLYAKAKKTSWYYVGDVQYADGYSEYDLGSEKEIIIYSASVFAVQGRDDVGVDDYTYDLIPAEAWFSFLNGAGVEIGQLVPPFVGKLRLKNVRYIRLYVRVQGIFGSNGTRYATNVAVARGSLVVRVL